MRAGKGSGSDARSLRAATADGLGASSGREDGVVHSPGAAPPPPSSPAFSQPRGCVGRARLASAGRAPPRSSAGPCAHADTARGVEGAVCPSGPKSLRKPKDGACHAPGLVSDLKKKTKKKTKV